MTRKTEFNEMGAMQSMTGYGRGRAEVQDVEIEVVIRSVNGRFYEPRFHAPKEYLEFESDLKKNLHQKIQRGTLDVYIHRRSRGSKGGNIRVNDHLVKSYMREWNSLAKNLKTQEKPLIRDLFRLPQAFHIEDVPVSLVKEKKGLQQAFAKAVVLLVKERSREGEALRKELLRLLDVLQKTVGRIEKLREKARAEHEIRWEEKIKQRAAVQPSDSQRISQELFIFMEKSDITEEIVRLKEHLMNYEGLLKGPKSEGKKLDFYTQELLREVNTIGSKSQVSSITQLVVESKTVIEKLREQVQNIE